MKRTNTEKNTNVNTKRKMVEPTRSSISHWTNNDVTNWLLDRDLRQFQEHFAGENIDGRKLLNFTEDQVRAIDDFTIDESDQDELWSALVKLRGYASPETVREVKDIEYNVDRKVIHDNIHGSMEFHPLLVKIIDTPQFQRLRNIKQLGCCSFVFPTACHQRFEHSIGVCHLAGKLLGKLKKKQPDLNILERDILCVEIAGLCHDLGHGPFSHMFDGRFIPAARPGEKWRHEDQSVKMFEHLLESNPDVTQAFKDYGLHNQSDLSFIKEQIAGPLGSAGYTSRDKKQAYLYEVVANKRNGIDVDKWDYFARDSRALGLPISFDHKRLMKFVRVLEVKGEQLICARDKEAPTLYDMFHTRRSLHSQAYKHKVCVAVEIMLSEAFEKADKYLAFYNKKGKKFSLSGCKDDCEAYTTCTDHVYYLILHSIEPCLQPARDIIEKIELRRLYKCVGETRPKAGGGINKSQLAGMRDEIVDSLSDTQLEGSERLHADDIVLNILRLDYGMGADDPIENVWFYVKSDPLTPHRKRRDEVSSMLPTTFSEQKLVAYCKRTDPDSMEVAEKCFKLWCSTQNMVPPKSQDMLNMTQS